MLGWHDSDDVDPNEQVTIPEAKLLRTTRSGLAGIFDIEGDEIMLPFSQIDGPTEIGEVGQIELPLWLARDRDLEP